MSAPPGSAPRIRRGVATASVIGVLCWIAAGLLLYSTVLRAEDHPSDAARQLIQLIEADFRRTSPFIGDTTLTPAVREALLQVPRHRFVPRYERPYAYENRPLSIGHGQTISQPYIVALMTELLRVQPGDRVLEIGTGSGYQAAILSPLVDAVYSIEIIPPLADSARTRLQQLGYDNVATRLGDGYYGWPEQAPFDGIIVTAAATQVPPPLIRQLRPGGRMVIPVGGRFTTQQLLLIDKDLEGQVHTRQILPVRFVPLTGGH